MMANRPMAQAPLGKQGFAPSWRSAQQGFTPSRRSAQQGFTPSWRSAQQGFTLVELLAAMIAGSLILATLSCTKW